MLSFVHTSCNAIAIHSPFHSASLIDMCWTAEPLCDKRRRRTISLGYRVQTGQLPMAASLANCMQLFCKLKDGGTEQVSTHNRSLYSHMYLRLATASEPSIGGTTLLYSTTVYSHSARRGGSSRAGGAYGRSVGCDKFNSRVPCAPTAQDTNAKADSFVYHCQSAAACGLLPDDVAKGQRRKKEGRRGNVLRTIAEMALQ